MSLLIDVQVTRFISYIGIGIYIYVSDYIVIYKKVDYITSSTRS